MIFPPWLFVALCVPAVLVLVWLIVEYTGSHDPYSIRRARKYGRGFADLLAYAALVQPDIILNKDGALMAAFEFVGQDGVTLDHGSLRRRIAYLNRMFCARDAGWMFHVDVIRRPAAPLAPPAYLRSAEERMLAEERLAHARDRFHNRYLMAVTYLPPTDAATKGHNWLLDSDEKIDVSFDAVRTAFTRGLEEIEDYLSPIASVRRLGERRIEDVSGNLTIQNEILEALVDVMYGDEQPVTIPPTPVMLSGLLGVHDLVAGMKPRIGSKHIGVLSLAGFPPASYPGILDNLLHINASFRFSTRIIIEDTQRAREKIDIAYRGWFGKRTSLAAKAFDESGGGRINRDADVMAEDAEEALQLLDRGVVRYGYYTGKIVLMSDDPSEVDAAKRELKKVFSKAGFLLRDETINAVDAYLGSLWGDGYHDLRKYMLHSLNTSDLLVSTAQWTGRKTVTCDLCPASVEPMAVVRTRGRGDFWLDLHHKDVMHTLSIGATGAGKTTLLNFLAGNFARTPDDQFFGLDFGYGMYTPCMFFGGEHIDPRGMSGSMRFSLFGHIEDPNERAWVADLMATICEVNQIVVTPRHREILDQTIEVFARTPPGNRSLSTFLPKLAAQDRTGELRMALQPYAVGGSLDGILDGVADEIRDSAFTVVELSNIVGGDNKERVLVPVMMALFHMIQRRLRNNRRTFVAIDEAWSHFRSPAALPKLEEALRTFRKLHAGVGLFTQNLDDIVNSPLATTVISACKTQLLLPNERASSTFADFYKTLGLGMQEIDAISTAQAKREYYFRSDDGCAMIDLDLSRAELAIYGRGSTDDIEEVRRLLSRNPDTWRIDLLRARGCPGAASRLESLNVKGRPDPMMSRKELAIA